MTVRQALVQAGIAPIDAQVLLAHVLRVDRAWLIAHATDPLAPEAVERFFSLAQRRRDGEPVAYLTGWREFWGMPLGVDRSVLMPRPETETLVECALRRLAAGQPLRVLELGTGSGAIALAIAQERPRADVLATDRSPLAITLAGENAHRMKLANVRLLQSDWYAGLPAAGERFDLIASNPPYVAHGDAHLSEAMRASSHARRFARVPTDSMHCASLSAARANGWRRAARWWSSTATIKRARCAI